MACTYIYKNNTIDQLSLAKEFYVNSRTLKNASIFSQEEIQNSTKSILLGQNKIGWATVNADDKNLITRITNFITNQNESYFKEIGEDRERLAPEYIVENRISKFVEEELKKGETPNVNVENIKVNLDYLKHLKKVFPTVDVDILKFYLVQIEEIIEIEQKTTIFGTGIHKLLEISLHSDKGFKTDEYNSELNKLITGNKEVFGDDVSGWVQSINKTIVNILNQISNTGISISEIQLISDPKLGAQLSGKIDLVMIDKSGTAHIYEVKISKHNYEGWDSAKLLTTDWQLALYRQLLSQHIDVRKTQLNVIPIQLSELQNPKALTFNKVINRNSESGNGLTSTGELTRIASKIIPSKVVVDYDPKREQRFEATIKNILPDYQIKTNSDIKSDEELLKSVIERHKKTGEWWFYNGYKAIEDLPLDYIKPPVEADTEEKIIDFYKDVISKFTTYLKSQKNRNVIILRDAINSAITNGSSISLNNKKREIVANKLLKDYISGEWEVVYEIDESVPLGVIVIRNKNTRIINLINISVNQQLADYAHDDLNYGDLENIKALLFANEFKNELLSGGFRLGEIVTYNFETGNNYYSNINNAFDKYKNRLIKSNESKLNKLNKSDLAEVEQLAWMNVRNAYMNYPSDSKNSIENIFGGQGDLNTLYQDLEKLKDIKELYLKTYPELKDRTFSPELNSGDPKEYLYALLQQAILIREGRQPYGDFLGLTDWALGFSDFKSLVAGFSKHKQSEFNKSGKKIQGLAGGMITITPDKIQSRDLNAINQLMNKGNSFIGREMVIQSENISEATRKYYEEIGFSKTSQNWVGETQSKYQDLFVQDDGKVSKEFMLKNPYDPSSGLTSSQAEYSKKILFEIQKYMLGLNLKDIKGLDISSLEALERSDETQDKQIFNKIYAAIQNKEYFKIPLVRREEISKYKGALDGGISGFWQKVKSRLHEVNDFIDPRELDPEQLRLIQDQSLGMYEMYDLYGIQTDDYKNRSLSKWGINYFELNLDSIAHRVAFNKIRKKTMDGILPIIHEYVWTMKLIAGKQPKDRADITKQLKYIENQLKQGVFDEPIIDEEFKDITTVTSAFKKLTTAGLLAFRPVLFMKEATIGIMKGASMAATQIYGKDQFNLSDLTKAYGKLMTIDKKFAPEWNLIDAINNDYRFANMDVNTIAKKLQTDRRGIFKGLNRWMYAMNTIPDYYNRLSLFLAKMIHDGSYEAHTITKGGKLTYDVKKDERFSYYLENRHKHTTKDGRYVPATSDVKYNTQRNLYLLLIQELNNENAGLSQEIIKESDLITKAYSEKERNSFKSFTDTAYGYYDKDHQAQVSNTWYGIIWMQFMQFWPGKMNMWFGRTISAEDSPIGRFAQKTVVNSEGKKVLLWRKPLYENPETEEEWAAFEEVEENTGDPALEWTGTPQEGLIHAVNETIKDALLGNWSNIKNEDLRNRRVLFALSDSIMVIFMLGLFKKFLDAYILENGTDGVSGGLAMFADNVNRRVLSEAHVYQNTIGALDSEPVFWSYGSQIARDLQSVFTSDKTIQEALNHNLKFTELWSE